LEAGFSTKVGDLHILLSPGSAVQIQNENRQMNSKKLRYPLGIKLFID